MRLRTAIVALLLCAGVASAGLLSQWFAGVAGRGETAANPYPIEPEDGLTAFWSFDYATWTNAVYGGASFTGAAGNATWSGSSVAVTGDWRALVYPISCVPSNRGTLVYWGGLDTWSGGGEYIILGYKTDADVGPDIWRFRRASTLRYEPEGISGGVQQWFINSATNDGAMTNNYHCMTWSPENGCQIYRLATVDGGVVRRILNDTNAVLNWTVSRCRVGAYNAAAGFGLRGSFAGLALGTNWIDGTKATQAILRAVSGTWTP